MKMAKASEADLEMAMELVNALEAISSRWGATMPEKIAKPPSDDEEEGFSLDDDENCARVCEYLIRLTRSASLMRVVWGAAVMLDPRNQCVDPDADTIEHHPDTIRWRKLRDLPATAVPPGPMRGWLFSRPGGAETLDKLADALPLPERKTEAA